MDRIALLHDTSVALHSLKANMFFISANWHQVINIPPLFRPKSFKSYTSALLLINRYGSHFSYA
ncbi:hypothetical protein MtrunA17_Chr4g0031211 [Medicago truncatula]|uniref:Uncharacterized protein n=1 Tax=Medicago truncatula TaxID=3880 RepID=A0A396I5L8_MEDTR|nr:hypothetical protein MtrunA17_Chr4g0031211 [Medicago truncatula]